MRKRIVLTLLLLAASGLWKTFEAGDLPRKIGLQRRVAWTTSRLTGSLETPPPFRTERIFSELKFNEPVTIAPMPGSNRLFVVELRGKIFSFLDDPSSKQLDLSVDLVKIPGHWRSYGLAFHPRFHENRQAYICYVLKNGDPKGSRVSRFKVSATDPPRIDLQSETILLEWPSGGHNGGCLQFGKDGYLYISTGDGSNPAPPDRLNTGQDISDLLASILRIDVDRGEAGKNYSIPKDNPFVKTAGARPEVWAYGFRNPWKMSFDPKAGDLWVGDVGWEMWEYIFRVERGGNYGWSLFEGRQPVRPNDKRGPTPVLLPTVDHDHTEARSITGGRFYYGSRLKDLYGAYIYGDYVTGKLWGLRHDGKKVTWQQRLADSALQIIDFGEGRDGELYILEYSGTINRLIPNPAAQANAQFPRKLSATGLFASVKDQLPAPGVLTYSINAEPWADHATAERFFAVPGTPKLGKYQQSNLQTGIVKGAWIYPNDTVFAKTISLEMERGNPASRRRLETQVLHRDGLEWRAYNYIWNEEQTDAVLAGHEGFDRTFTVRDTAEPTGKRQQTWHFAGRTECLICHTTRAGSILGFNIAQLNRDHAYGKITGHQLATFEHLGMFADPLPKASPRIAHPFDPKESLHDRARAYLHTNCAHCHRRGGGGTAVFELLHDLDLKKTLLVGTAPSQGSFGIHAAENVAAGDPFRSVLYYRMAKLGRGRMPYSGSSLIDPKGLALVHDWVKTLAPEAKTPSLTDAQQAALKELATPTKSRDATTRLLASTSGALALLGALDAQALPQSIRKEILSQATAHPDAQIRELFERFVPEEQRVQRLGAVIKPAEILALPGDRARGRQVFMQAGQCKNCHRVDQEGGDIGPDLSQVGKKLERANILESILDPSKVIEPAYTTHLVETSNGTVYSGLLVSKSAKEVVLKDAQGRITAVPAQTVESIVPQRVSLMPELLLRDMTAREVADLLEFLGSLR
jgi:putative heme-binding domain-containing protein